jgi:trimethylamine--corrinoid protein Co-methyltransferase
MDGGKTITLMGPEPGADKRRDKRSRRPERKRVNVVPPGLEGGWYRPIRDEDVQRIHQASLEVLERTGIEVMPSECREIFRQAGARIDAASNRVFIPRSMVEDALAKARNEVVLCGRDPRHDIRLGGWRVHMGTGGAAIKVLDLNTGRMRKSTLADVARIGRLVDALDNIHFYLRACVAQDIPTHLLDVNTYYAAHQARHWQLFHAEIGTGCDRAGCDDRRGQRGIAPTAYRLLRHFLDSEPAALRP